MKRKYDKIYTDLKNRIETEEYKYQELIPPESALIRQYDCSRNTVRRAIAQLADEGYVVSVNGKGVVVIYKQNIQAKFALGGTDMYREVSEENRKKYHTKVLCFTELTVDERISKRTTFSVGREIYYIQSARMIQDETYIIDHNYFLKDMVKGLAPEIAERSIHEYIEGQLQETIASTRRMMTLDLATELDEKYMDLGKYGCVAVVNSYVFNADGLMFEYIQSRHKPEGFVFYEQSNANPVSYLM
ncbi:MAG TPA: UTRA domain-containing protein [Candidatus Mediterraneibacter norfolkensis]|nr:UTRA domain-containing protein [Candidatus Mediterraneibacter norfolkensis]